MDLFMASVLLVQFCKLNKIIYLFIIVYPDTIKLMQLIITNKFKRLLILMVMFMLTHDLISM